MERLSFLEQIFHKLSEHGIVQFNMQGAMILDPAKGTQKITAMDLAEHIAARLDDAPILHKKLVQDRLKLGDIKLVDDPEFDVWDHITFSTLPSPGDHRALFMRLGRFSAEPLDLKRPLWRFEIIEGLEGGKFAIAQKMSHAVMDGMAVMKLMQRLFDTESKALDKHVPTAWQAEPEPSELQLLEIALSENAHRIAAQASKAALNTYLRIAKAGIALAQEYLDEEEKPRAQQAGRNPRPPRTSLNQAMSPDRRNIAYVTYEVDKLKAIGKALGYTLNDLCLAMAAEAMNCYFDGIDEALSGNLKFCMPMSDSDPGRKERGNFFNVAIINVHNRTKSLSKRLEAIHKQTGVAKEKRATAPKNDGVSFEEITSMLSPLVIDSVGMLLNAIEPWDNLPLPINTALSNVPGPREALYFAGMPVECSIPMIPFFHGAAMSIGATSMGNVFTISFHACGKCVRRSNMHFLTDGLDKAYAELCALVENQKVKPLKPARTSAAKKSASPKVAKPSARKTAAHTTRAAIKPETANRPKSSAKR